MKHYSSEEQMMHEVMNLSELLHHFLILYILSLPKCESELWEECK